MRKVLFVYNPNAGKGRILHHLDEVVNIFEQEGFQVALYRTKGPLDGKREVQENIDVFDRIVCAGGDGTLSEIVSAMMELPEEKRKPIGFLPTGSTNDTGKSYHIPGQVTEAMKVAAQGIPFEINCGAYNRGRKKELYPNTVLLKKLKELGGEILISSDAHQKELLDGGFDFAVQKALECGFTHTNLLTLDQSGQVEWRQMALA